MGIDPPSFRRILGLDPGLKFCGWGVIESNGSILKYIASGRIVVSTDGDLASRLASLHQQLQTMLAEYHPDLAAVEEVFVNTNAVSTLKLGMARGIVLAVPALSGVPVVEFAANTVKKSIVGRGHADKNQVAHMVKLLLPASNAASADEADALAVAITAAHHNRVL